MKLLILIIALTMVSPLALGQSTASADVDWAERFAPMQWLTKRCWKATFPDGVTTDQHCFGYQYGDKFIHDSHVVTGPNPTYRGETLYAWDAENEQITYWYWTNLGSYSTGVMHVMEDGALYSPERHVADDGTITELRSVWRYDGDSSFTSTQQQKVDGQWQAVWEIVYHDIRRNQAADVSVLKDSNGLVFTRYHNESHDLIKLGGDGNAVAITDSAATDWVYAGGAEPLFVSRRGVPKGERGYLLYRLRADGSFKRAFEHLLSDSAVSLSRDGRRYAVAMHDGNDTELWLVNVESGHADRLTDNACKDTDPNWSASDEWLVYRSDCGGASDIWRMRLADGHVEQLTSNASNDGELGYGGEGPPRYSPDGQTIAWMSHDGDWEIALMDADGSNQRQLTTNDINDSFPAWSPSGQLIAFNSDRDGNEEIYVIDVTSRNVSRMTFTPEPEYAPVFISP